MAKAGCPGGLPRSPPRTAIAPGAAIVDHELLRSALGDALAQILGDERQREVDAGGDAGRGPNRPVSDEDTVGLDADLRTGAGGLGGGRPMRGGAATVEQPGSCEDERSRAHAGDPPRAVAGGADKGQSLDTGGCLPRALAAGNDFALTLVAEIAGPETAQAIQLQIEYAPAPPLDAGLPETASPAILAPVRERSAAMGSHRPDAVDAAAARLAAV